LARVSRKTPLFLLLDDLQWADEATLALVHYLATRVGQLPVIIVGTYRDSRLDTSPALVRTLEELLRTGLRPLKLGGLSQEAVGQAGETAPSLRQAARPTRTFPRICKTHTGFGIASGRFVPDAAIITARKKGTQTGIEKRMPQTKIAPYGSWKSPITSDLIVAQITGLSEVRLVGDDIYWLEGRPQEQGRNVIVRGPDGTAADITPAGFKDPPGPGEGPGIVVGPVGFEVDGIGGEDVIVNLVLPGAMNSDDDAAGLPLSNWTYGWITVGAFDFYN
jgi:hypothetical protein